MAFRHSHKTAKKRIRRQEKLVAEGRLKPPKAKKPRY